MSAIPDHLGDYSVVNEYGGISSSELAALEANEMCVPASIWVVPICSSPTCTGIGLRITQPSPAFNCSICSGDSYEQTDRQLTESFEQIRLLAWGLILFVALIGLLNIINTVYTNIHTRIAEIGMQLDDH